MGHRGTDDYKTLCLLIYGPSGGDSLYLQVIRVPKAPSAYGPITWRGAWGYVSLTVAKASRYGTLQGLTFHRGLSTLRLVHL